jgi:integrase
VQWVLSARPSGQAPERLRRRRRSRPDAESPAALQSVHRLAAASGHRPDGSFHSLRHAFGTHAIRAGANIEAVRELMGYDDLETTAGYLHAVAADKVAVIEAIGQLAGNSA